MDEIMTTPEVSAYLRVHPSSIYKMLKKGQLPAFRVGTDWRFRRSAIDAWTEAQQAKGEK